MRQNFNKHGLRIRFSSLRLTPRKMWKWESKRYPQGREETQEAKSTVSMERAGLIN